MSYYPYTPLRPKDDEPYDGSGYFLAPPPHLRNKPMLGSGVIRNIEGLPKELTKQLHPDKCDLCVVVLNSTLQAKMHYNGKNHAKKTRQFLIHWCEGKGENLQQAAKLFLDSKSKSNPEAKDGGSETNGDDSKVDDLYCKCCDLSFTSPQHAHQHYMGRNHQRRSQGLTPLKTGYFNRITGRWQRFRPGQDDDGQPTGYKGASRPSPYGAPGGFNAFKPFEPSTTGGMEGTDKDIDYTEAAEAARRRMRGEFKCELCGVFAPSQDQINMHLNGAKHKAKVQEK